VDLNSASPRIVIEGNISEGVGTYYVKLSQTVNFDQRNNFPPVTGAVITISDTSGSSETLEETQPGSYRTSEFFQGELGRTYTLKVDIQGKEYIAHSTMPYTVYIDSLSVVNMPFGRNNSKVVNVHFNDPAGISNYYRFVEEVNGVTQKYIFLTDDRLQDGQNITASLFSADTTIHSGDQVMVYLQCIDKGVYEYFRTAELISEGRGGESASPTNPISNFSNGALGYFSAYAVSSAWILVP